MTAWLLRALAARDRVAQALLAPLTWALLRLARRTPYTHIGDYMRRWWLVRYNRRGLAVRVHEILRSDRDPHMHDHPWPFVSVVLRGGYWEWRPRALLGGVPVDSAVRATWHGPGSVLFRRHDDWHRLDVDPAVGPAVTLFVTGRYRHTWGFAVGGAKVPHGEYLRARRPDVDPALIADDPAKYAGGPT